MCDYMTFKGPSSTLYASLERIQVKLVFEPQYTIVEVGPSPSTIGEVGRCSLKLYCYGLSKSIILNIELTLIVRCQPPLSI